MYRHLRTLAYLSLTLLSVPSAWARSQALVPLQIRFAAVVGDKPFACGNTYNGVGANKVSWQPQDLRFYVSDVALRRADGSTVPVTLTADGTWQDGKVALLDFEDRTGSCQNGTQATNLQLRGTVPSEAGVTGLQFKVAVPFAANHADASTQDPPLDQAGLFWGWQMGHKFFSLEGRVGGEVSHTVHVGSTGCTMAQPNKVDSCSALNVIDVVLPAFDYKTQTVQLDVAEVLGASTLGGKTPAGASCMSEHDNAACAPIFARLGLPHPAARAAAAVQTAFKAR